MSEQINRQKLIEAIEKEYHRFIDNDRDVAHNRAIYDVLEIIKAQPPADQWIPCSSGVLPNDEREVMVTLTHTYEDDYTQRSVARYLRFENGEAYWCDNRYGYIGWAKYSDGYVGTSNYKVTAWMPLPEPYKGVE